jgi:hypothetical protein
MNGCIFAFLFWTQARKNGKGGWLICDGVYWVVEAVLIDFGLGIGWKS